MTEEQAASGPGTPEFVPETKPSIWSVPVHFPTTTILFILCLAWSLFASFRGAGGSDPALLAHGAIQRSLAMEGQWWRLVTCTFLEPIGPRGFLAAWNLLCLPFLGWYCEALFGGRSTLIIGMSAALGGNSMYLLMEESEYSGCATLGWGWAGALLGLFVLSKQAPSGRALIPFLVFGVINALNGTLGPVLIALAIGVFSGYGLFLPIGNSPTVRRSVALGAILIGVALGPTLLVVQPWEPAPVHLPPGQTAAQIIQRCNEEISKGAENYENRLLRAAAYVKEGLLSEALADLQRCIALDRNRPEAYFTRAAVHDRLRMPNQAESDRAEGRKRLKK